MTSGFVLPNNWMTYHAEIKDRCANLISYKIWNGIENDKLSTWLKNFESDEEKYLSACILDSLMYRSNSKTKALIYHLFNVVLPNYTRLNRTPFGEINDWFERLKSLDVDPKLRIVVAVSENDPPTKSAHHVARLLKNDFGVHDGWIIHPNKIKYHPEIKMFVFIDDFIGSGEQFEEIILEYGLHRLKDTYTLYAPLAAHDKGVAYLTSSYGDSVKIASSETISIDSNFFNKYFAEDAEKAREVYRNILRRKNLLPQDVNRIFGHGNLEIAYSFEHACPDNSLNLLWLDRNGWNPLFNR